MIINFERKFAIFLPWKTASSTMFTRMAYFNQSSYSRFYDFNVHLKRIVHQHITVADFKGLPESLLPLKKIAFVRNPYDRVYSGFLQIQKDLKEQPDMPYPEPWIKNHVMKQLEANEKKLRLAGYNFDNWVALLQPEDVLQIGGNSSFPLYPAHYWTHDNDKLFVDFIGKVETFEEDFKKMLEFLDISDSYNLENANINFLTDEQSDSDYKYLEKMSEASIQKINSLFSNDFKLFGYKKL
ncbi:MAG: sulfotransferase family 2 domain-containing protein [Bacteroidales bacterium]|jgi:hypothetical protein|nr:sulfotransferase family protein [Bacteroidales bacterium]MDD4214160.1 sulfotransferase family 2 domain-containing protein [Bacteroidales bacterium]